MQLRRKWGCTPVSRLLGARARRALPDCCSALRAVQTGLALQRWRSGPICLLFRFQSETVRGLKC